MSDTFRMLMYGPYSYRKRMPCVLGVLKRRLPKQLEQYRVRDPNVEVYFECARRFDHVCVEVYGLSAIPVATDRSAFTNMVRSTIRSSLCDSLVPIHVHDIDSQRQKARPKKPTKSNRMAPAIRMALA